MSFSDLLLASFRSFDPKGTKHETLSTFSWPIPLKKTMFLHTFNETTYEILLQKISYSNVRGKEFTKQQEIEKFFNQTSSTW